MQCPVCEESRLVMAERQGIEIDYCPTCRGVWLDRGELDKIIERSLNQTGAHAQVAEAPSRDVPRGPRRDDRDDENEARRQGGRRKKRGGFLSDLFDFEGLD